MQLSYSKPKPTIIPHMKDKKIQYAYTISANTDTVGPLRIQIHMYVQFSIWIKSIHKRNITFVTSNTVILKLLIPIAHVLLTHSEDRTKNKDDTRTQFAGNNNWEYYTART